MSTNRIVAWKPAVNNQFAQATSTKLELYRIDEGDEHHRGRDAVLIASLANKEQNQISCIEWQYSVQNPLLAYSTTRGSVNLVNWEGSFEQNIYNESARSPKRAVTSLSWSLVDSTKIVAGLEASQSAESSIMIWDVEYKQALKFQHYESCSSLTWFPGSSNTVVSGNTMGWVKIFDTRSNSQSPVMQWLAHGANANRPRKIKGLRPDFVHDSNVLATFSDAYGDFVKVWDFRNILTAKTAGKKTGVLQQSFGINPFFAGHDISNASGVINDCAWSPIRPGVIAVATSSQKCISFFRLKENSKDNAPSLITSSPLSTISSPDQVRSLSWQVGDQPLRACSSTPITEALLSNDSTAETAVGINKFENVEFGEKMRNEIIKHNNGPGSPITAQRECTSKRLMGALLNGLLDIEVRDDIPFSYGSRHLATLSPSRKIAVAPTTIDQFKVPDPVVIKKMSLSEKLLYCFKDQNQLIKDRARCGYSLDAATNIDILTDELNYLHKSMSDKADPSMALANMTLSNSIYEIYRVWEWLDRFEASSSDSKSSIQKAGVLQVLNILHANKLSDIDRKIDDSFVTIHPDTGAPMYYSKNRASIRKLCGWVHSFLLEGSNNNSTNSLAAVSSFTSSKSKNMSAWGDVASRSEIGSSDENDMLAHLVENCMQYSFERAAAVALWHGDINLAVNILHDAVQNHNKGKLQDPSNVVNPPQQKPSHGDLKDDDQQEDMSSDSKESFIEWDYPVSDTYMQVVALVGMCLAGYVPNSQSDSSKLNINRDRQPWKTMCDHAIYQLRAFERTAASYLSAGCLFLLCNCNDTSMNQKSIVRYSNILDDPNLVLEDRLSFAAHYLDDEDLANWLLQLKQICLKKGALEGLLLTGLSSQGCEILQGFMDRTNDIQTTALIASRVLHSNESNANKEDESLRNRVTIWLHAYRTLLCKWNLNIERAHLDIEIGQRVQKNKHNQIAKTVSVSAKSETTSTNTVAVTNNNRRAPVQGQTQIQAQAQLQSRIPLYEGALNRTSKKMQFSCVKLKCGFCNAFLPMDDVPSTKTETLRSGKNILNCCSNCGKQLPRCYVCQLHMGIVNPYLQLQRLADEMRANNLAQIENRAKEKAQPPTGYNTTGNKIEDSLIGFGKWFLFCQRCRHGGHTTCISSWFEHLQNRSGKSEMYCFSVDNQARVQERINTICGVNGCNCECQWLS